MRAASSDDGHPAVAVLAHGEGLDTSLDTDSKLTVCSQ